MIMKLNFLLKDEIYSKEDILSAALIIHPNKIDKYWLKMEELTMVFEEWSNFIQLENPILDEFGNQYWDSEWYYMAQRVDNIEIKKMIAFCSIGQWLSKKSAYLKQDMLETDLKKRINFMKKAIKQKFDNNQKLKELLIATWDREIIEYTYWLDITFGVDSVTNKWKNILWKLLMEYRDDYKWLSI